MFTSRSTRAIERRPFSGIPERAARDSRRYATAYPSVPLAYGQADGRASLQSGDRPPAGQSPASGRSPYVYASPAGATPRPPTYLRRRHGLRNPPAPIPPGAGGFFAPGYSTVEGPCLLSSGRGGALGCLEGRALHHSRPHRSRPPSWQREASAYQAGRLRPSPVAKPPATGVGLRLPWASQTDRCIQTNAISSEQRNHTNLHRYSLRSCSIRRCCQRAFRTCERGNGKFELSSVLQSRNNR